MNWGQWIVMTLLFTSLALIVAGFLPIMLWGGRPLFAASAVGMAGLLAARLLAEVVNQ